MPTNTFKRICSMWSESQVLEWNSNEASGKPVLNKQADQRPFSRSMISPSEHILQKGCFTTNFKGNRLTLPLVRLWWMQSEEAKSWRAKCWRTALYGLSLCSLWSMAQLCPHPGCPIPILTFPGYVFLIHKRNEVVARDEPCLTHYLC